MAFSTNETAAAGGGAGSAQGPVTDLRWFVFGLFFIFGGITSLNDILIPKLKALFALSQAEAMLVQSAFFVAYFLISMPAAAIVQRIGYMRAAVVGLLTMTVGCLLFLPASSLGLFPAFLAALFVLASGITIVQVVANPLISMLGAPATASSRLTFAQAFNSLGTTIFPYVGAKVILGSLAAVDESRLPAGALALYRAQATRAVDHTYLAIAVALLTIAALVWLRRDRLVEERAPAAGFVASLDLLRRPRFAFGAASIFLYVGAEVSIGSLLVSYLTQADTLAIAAQQAGELVALYWGGAMIGRFAGAGLLRRFAAANVLAAAGLLAIVLLAVSGSTLGALSGAAILTIGLFNSIMFPTIFSLASEGLGPRAAEGSGLICMAIVGGAIVPPLTGHVADLATLRTALFVPAACYVGIAAFALHCHAHPIAAGPRAVPPPGV